MEPPPQPADPAAPIERPVRWGLGDVALGLLVGLTLSSLFAALWLAVSGGPDLDLTGQALSEIGLWTGLVGSALLASRRKGRGTLGADFGFRLRWSDLALGPAVAVGVQLLVLPLLSLLLRPLLGQPEVSGPVRDLMDKASGPAFIGLVATVAVGAPIVEELFFRGLLLRSLQRRMPDALAIALSSVAFGLAHASTLPADAVILVILSLTIFGAVLATLAVRTGRLGPGILAHATFNLFTVIYLAATR
ncbi:MAG: CPBP family intramembrane metalloprotease [Actinomycetota bacterium]|nr:CPBP family intramembrane metalloprotease [Actinomycetota bacterium]